MSSYSAITASPVCWKGPVKLDFFVERASGAHQIPRPAVRLLFEKAPLRLKTGWEPSRQDVARQIDSVIRATLQGASWPVRLLRRGQWMTHAFSELTLIHNVIVPLLLVQHDARAFHRNAMTRERLLTDEQRAEIDRLTQEVLTALAARSAAASLQAHLRIVDVMGHAGRSACAAFDLDFPEAAEREARRLYEREWLGLKD